MSLYSIEEICSGCVKAAVCSECGTIKFCGEGHIPDFMRGKCEHYEEYQE
jgi:hypothetical protein